MHLVRGYALLKSGDFRINVDHPPLANAFDSLPLLFLDLKFDFNDEYWKTGNKDFLASKFFYDWNQEKIWEMLFWGEAMNLLFFVGTLIAVFFGARKLFGAKISWIAFFMASFSPNLLAHGGVVTTDMPATFFTTLIALFFIFNLDKLQDFKKTFLISIIIFLAMITKYSSFLLLPIVFFVYFFKTKKFLLHIFLIAFLNFFFLSGFFGFKFSSIEDSLGNDEMSKVTVDAFLNGLDGHSKDFATWFYKDFKTPFPEYLRGFLYNGVGHFAGLTRERTAYLFGRYSTKGFREFFIVSFLLKSAIFLPIFFGIFIFLKFKTRKFSSEEKVLLLMIFLIYLVSSFGGLNLGYRHTMIVEPIIVILSSSIFAKKLKFDWLLYLIFVFGISSVIKNRSNLIGYINEFIPENERYRVFNDSNLEWQQTWFFAREFVKKMNEKNFPTIMFSESKAEFIEKNYDGYVVISANSLSGWNPERVKKVEFLRKKEPIYVIQGSYYVFEV